MDVYLLRIDGPLLPSWAEELARAGAELLERLDATTSCVRLAISDVNATIPAGGGYFFGPSLSALRAFAATPGG